MCVCMCVCVWSSNSFGTFCESVFPSVHIFSLVEVKHCKYFLLSAYKWALLHLIYVCVCMCVCVCVCVSGCVVVVVSLTQGLRSQSSSPTQAIFPCVFHLPPTSSSRSCPNSRLGTWHLFTEVQIQGLFSYNSPAPGALLARLTVPA